MSFLQIWKTWFCFAWLPLFFSGSKASTSSTTNNVDQRLALEQGAVGASASGGSKVTINTLDGGAINAAFGLGNHAIEEVTDLATASLSASHHTAEKALQGAFGSIEGTKQAMQDAVKEVATAYEDAKVGNRANMTMGMMLIGGAAVLVVGVMALKGK